MAANVFHRHQRLWLVMVEKRRTEPKPSAGFNLDKFAARSAWRGDNRQRLAHRLFGRQFHRFVASLRRRDCQRRQRSRAAADDAQKNRVLADVDWHQPFVSARLFPERRLFDHSFIRAVSRLGGDGLCVLAQIYQIATKRRHLARTFAAHFSVNVVCLN